jgi:hypothetical protein
MLTVLVNFSIAVFISHTLQFAHTMGSHTVRTLRVLDLYKLA